MKAIFKKADKIGEVYLQQNVSCMKGRVEFTYVLDCVKVAQICGKVEPKSSV